MQEVVTTTQRRFTASDGVELSYYVWSRDQSRQGRALVLILHGIGFYARPYIVAAESIGVPGALFAALDFRGHGDSGGVRGHMASTRRMLEDVGEWIDHMQASFPGAKTFLIAESMAGPYGSLYAVQNSGRLDGLILIAPAVLLSWRQVFHPNSFKSFLKLLTSPSSPGVELGESRLRAGIGDAAFVFDRSKHELMIQSVSPKYVLRIGEAIARLILRPRLSTRASVLIIHGERDNILSPLGSRLLSYRLKAPDKGLVILPDAHHTLIWDSSSPAVFALIEAWISERLGST